MFVYRIHDVSDMKAAFPWALLDEKLSESQPPWMHSKYNKTVEGLEAHEWYSNTCLYAPSKLGIDPLLLMSTSFEELLFFFQTPKMVLQKQLAVVWPMHGADYFPTLLFSNMEYDDASSWIYHGEI
jgi:hypothetical protein